MSSAARQVWHGDAVPCVSCGQLVHRDDTTCESCGQDLSEQMLQRMRAHAGPWYVLEHVRPFPGVALERIVRQIRRGVLTDTSIIRGPATHHQWRFAVETPGICRFFDRCWHCHEPITAEQEYCPACLVTLDFEEEASGDAPAARASEPAPVRGGHAPTGGRNAWVGAGRVSAGLPTPQTPVTPPPGPGGTANGSGAGAAGVGAVAVGGGSPPPVVPTGPATGTTGPTLPPELQRLSAVLERAPVPRRHETDVAPRVGSVPATWIAALLVVVVIVGFLAIGQCRSRSVHQTRPATTALLTEFAP
ncbi:MAG TPA: zinc ribbon domain-containing protein [Phycisphaerae bacterium]|nr:zinc ribbon domain-containing protein [Phycisphaerae bacterium]HNU45805.1 zinc ribbon domain-containing protein [Phycisphaerae bacterium]